VHHRIVDPAVADRIRVAAGAVGARDMREGIERRISEIERLVDEGKISREEAARGIEEIRRAMAEATSGDDEMDARRQRYAEVEARIKRAIESGEMSREEAERKLVEMRREIFGGE
jgi:polyhydroxyalkanoate synthesis regulator phasin